MPERAGTGRPRQFCRRSCRQRDYESRQRSAEVGLSDAELVITRQALNELHDKLYVLEAAVEDVRRDLEADDSPAEVRRALDWLIEAAHPLVSTPVKLQ